MTRRTTCLCLAFIAGVWCAAVAVANAANIPSSGENHPELAPLDEVMQKLLTDHDIPGGTLAVSKEGRLVYARGFGYADLEAQEPVQPTSRFRIASISKPITAVAVMQLVEQGKLQLDDKIFELLAVEPASEEVEIDSRLERITVLNCLQHTGGWDRDKSFDPMFRSVQFAKTLKLPPPTGAAEVIRCMLGVPLDFNPGERYSYSNFGYCLLGRAIEKVSGKTYEEYVRTAVLAPLEIRDMQLGKTLADGRAEGEVCYYDDGTGLAVLGDKLGQAVPHPYGAWYLEAMDSHGGWIASAVDLVKFAAALDDRDHCGVLSRESIDTMFARPEGGAGVDEQGQPKPAYYACGWNVRPVGTSGASNTWHGGSLPGTSTLLVRRHDGIDWAVLFNRRERSGKLRPSHDADQRINQALNAIRRWPEKTGSRQ